MPKRSLIVYASLTGNTEEVAYRFKKAFEKKGWMVDTWKIDDNTDLTNSKFNVKDYDFLCVGSPVIHKKPVEPIVNFLSRAGRPPPGISGGEPPPGGFSGGHPPAVGLEAKIVFGPDTKNAVAFCTYAGMHLGSKEVEPAISLIDLLIEHIPFRVLGRFACPGKYGDNIGWYTDLKERPNEKDLQKAETFIEEILEDME